MIPWRALLTFLLVPGPARDGYAQRLKSLTALPLIVKGVLRADDAIATIDACKATCSTFLFLPT